MTHHHPRPRASDFDEPMMTTTRFEVDDQDRLGASTSQQDHHLDSSRTQVHSRQPSTNDLRSRRLTPEESLDHHHHHHHHHHHQSRTHPDRHQLIDSRLPPRSSNHTYHQTPRDDFFESRRLQREDAQSTCFWPVSPPRAYGERRKKKVDHHQDDQHHRKKSKDHHRSHHKSSKSHSSHLSDSDRSQSHHRSHRKRRSNHHPKSSRTKHDPTAHQDSSDRDHRAKPRKSTQESESSQSDSDQVWIEKVIPTTRITQPEPTTTTTTTMTTTTTATTTIRKDSITGPSRPTKLEEPSMAIVDQTNASLEDRLEDDSTEVGPMPYNHATGKAMDPKEFGRALRPGEGSAMAAFIEAGERIPRRGEIGLTGNEIEKFENVGYVMSGSRHRRMNAVRIRKENQVISAEEKRGILKMQAEEKAKREGQIISSFRELVDTKLQETAN